MGRHHTPGTRRDAPFVQLKVTQPPFRRFAVHVPHGVQYQPRQSIELRCLVFYEDEPV
jgi:hypothetical protein